MTLDTPATETVLGGTEDTALQATLGVEEDGGREAGEMGDGGRGSSRATCLQGGAGPPRRGLDSVSPSPHPPQEDLKKVNH